MRAHKHTQTHTHTHTHTGTRARHASTATPLLPITNTHVHAHAHTHAQAHGLDMHQQPLHSRRGTMHATPTLYLKLQASAASAAKTLAAKKKKSGGQRGGEGVGGSVGGPQGGGGGGGKVPVLVRDGAQLCARGARVRLRQDLWYVCCWIGGCCRVWCGGVPDVSHNAMHRIVLLIILLVWYGCKICGMGVWGVVLFCVDVGLMFLIM